jgi:hypothetical protein
VFGCGAKLPDYNAAVAHKVLYHDYHYARISKAEAAEILAALGQPMVVPGSTSLPTAQSEEDDERANKTTVSAGWTPLLNLDLNDLGLAMGEASRFAVGDDGDARFYFVRLLKDPTIIKGRFVWTKFAHRFASEKLYQNDFVVRKMAGETKEWIGMQRKSGVWNTRFDHNDPNSERYIHKDIYVGTHEEDIAAILEDPYGCRVRYGKLIGKCGYCGLKLTDPESRLRGIGPDCWKTKGITAYYRQHCKLKAAQP